MYVLRPIATGVLMFSVLYTIISIPIAMMLSSAGYEVPPSLAPPLPFFGMVRGADFFVGLGTAIVMAAAAMMGVPMSLIVGMAFASYISGAIINLCEGLAAIMPYPLLAMVLHTMGYVLYTLTIIYLIAKGAGYEI